LACQNLYEAVNNIPVHIGVSNLKHILYHALLPQFLDWSKGFPLSIEECELRDKNWVQLLPRQPDINAIAEQFFEAKPRSKVKVFSSKKSADLSLCVKNEKYQEVLQHLINLDEASEEVGTQALFYAFNTASGPIYSEAQYSIISPKQCDIDNSKPREKTQAFRC